MDDDDDIIKEQIHSPRTVGCGRQPGGGDGSEGGEEGREIKFMVSLASLSFDRIIESKWKC